MKRRFVLTIMISLFLRAALLNISGSGYADNVTIGLSDSSLFSPQRANGLAIDGAQYGEKTLTAIIANRRKP